MRESERASEVEGAASTRAATEVGTEDRASTAAELGTKTEAGVGTKTAAEFGTKPSRSRWLSSTITATLVFGVVAGVAGGIFWQWKQQSVLHALPLASRDCVEKWDGYLQSKNDPDCLLLGSSVFLVPAMYIEEHRSGHTLKSREADAELAKRLIRCTTAPELQRDLSEQLHKNVSVTNLAVAGTNVSDFLLELKAMHTSGHHPKLIVCGLGVRDFVQSFFRMNANNNPAARLIQRTADAKQLNAALFSDFREGCIANLFWDFRKVLHSKQAELTNSAPVQYVPKSDEEVAAKLTETLLDAPKHPAFIESQIDAYKEMIQFCHDNKIPLMVVEVPKRTGWAGVIDDATVSRIKSTIVDECKTYNIPYSDAEGGFTPSDFADDIHPNEIGGVKMFHKVADAIVRYGVL